MPIGRTSSIARTRRVAVIAAAALALPGAAAGVQQTGRGLPDTPATERVEGLVEAMNSGSVETLRAFVEAHYTDRYSGFGSAQALTNYWAGVHQEVGPMAVEVFEKLPLADRELDVYWTRGTDTRFWIGIRLDIESEPPHRIEGNSVLRGVRPQGGPRVDRTAAGTEPYDADRLQEYMDGWLAAAERGDRFWGSIAILKDGALVYENAVGWADRERGGAATVDTRYRLASVTKMFTGVAIGQLVESGDLSWDDPLSKFLPEYPRHIADQVTIHHLLTHTSGIELDDDADYNRAVRQATTMQDLLDAQLTYIERLNRGNYDDFAPLTEFDYTNEGIDLLGLIVERASGQAWPDYLREHVFGPAGMASTGAYVLADLPGLAASYSVRAGSGDWLPGPRPVTRGSVTGSGGIRPAGSGWSTAGDMARFVAALSDGTLIGRETYERMTTGHVVAGRLPGEELAYGYTVNVDRRGGVRVLGHGGGAPGISTNVRWYPDEGWTVIVLSNLDRVGNHAFWHIEEMLGVR